jgi:hypothetical protein
MYIVLNAGQWRALVFFLKGLPQEIDLVIFTCANSRWPAAGFFLF